MVIRRSPITKDTIGAKVRPRHSSSKTGANLFLPPSLGTLPAHREFYDWIGDVVENRTTLGPLRNLPSVVRALCNLEPPS